MKTHNDFARFIDVVHQLRKKCPWDRKQTHKTLIPYLIEEAYEAVEAIEKQDTTSLKEELGDLLLQIALHCEIARGKKEFSIDDVSKAITDKMIRRHPHVFGDVKVKNVKAILKNWARLKGEERPQKSLLGGIPKAMPALQLAQRYGEIAASVGFDWPTVKDVLDKVNEELSELKEEIRRRNRRKSDLEMELGDLLFVLTRLAGHLGINAEISLKKSASKFASRFGQLEREKSLKGKKLTDFTLEELEASWQRLKRVHKR
ncbi:MAG: nucleoside triphosphate pyrophosphohydrolase [Deltaproteobacteria bacterium]|nr:nucleoside triphosphate pyrophosphohydrolase [Deltaproteobacteria bacterium]